MIISVCGLDPGNADYEAGLCPSEAVLLVNRTAPRNR